MKDFLDLTGASGAVYRFRLWPEGAPHQPIAGNYVILRQEEAGAFTVLLVGATNDLSLARAQWGKVTRKQPTHVFTRLNVARARRCAEHDDLAAAFKDAVIVDG